MKDLALLQCRPTDLEPPCAEPTDVDLHFDTIHICKPHGLLLPVGLVASGAPTSAAPPALAGVERGVEYPSSPASKNKDGSDNANARHGGMSVNHQSMWNWVLGRKADRYISRPAGIRDDVWDLFVIFKKLQSVPKSGGGKPTSWIVHHLYRSLESHWNPADCSWVLTYDHEAGAQQGHGLIHPSGPTSAAPDEADQYLVEPSGTGGYVSKVLVDNLGRWKYVGILLKAKGLVDWLHNPRDAEPTVVECAEALVNSAQQLRDSGIPDESNPYEQLSEKLYDEIASRSQDESLVSAFIAFKAALSESEREYIDRLDQFAAYSAASALTAPDSGQ